MPAHALKAAIIINTAALCLVLAAGARAATDAHVFDADMARPGAARAPADAKDWRGGWRDGVLRVDASGAGATLSFAAPGVTLRSLRVSAVDASAVKGASGWGGNGGEYRLTLFNTALEAIYSRLRTVPGKGGHDDLRPNAPDVGMLQVVARLPNGASAGLLDISLVAVTAAPPATAGAIAPVDVPPALPLLSAAFAALGLAQCAARRRRHAA